MYNSIMNGKLLMTAMIILIGLTLNSGCLNEQTGGLNDSFEDYTNEFRYTTFFTNLTVENAQELINKSVNLTIIDYRNKEIYEIEWIPNAIYGSAPENFFNETNDLLIYSHNGGSSTEFCKKLVNHTYGEIYNLEGGINAWKNAGYTTETVYTKFFTNITGDDVKDLINNSINLTIVDCTSCECRINWMIPNAIWIESPGEFYFTKDDLLIYSYDGKTSFEFCKKMVNYCYGSIYNLEGGINAWKNESYIIEIP